MQYINKTILMSDADHFDNTQQINPYYHQEPVDYKKAIAEHAEIKKLLIQAGIEIISVPSPIDSQDGVYTANWGLVRDDMVVLSRLPNARKNEENYAEKILTGLGKKVTRVPDDLKFSGQGDALACGNYLFCGSGYRSDAEAQKFAADTLGYERIQLRTTPEQDSYGNLVINQASGWPDSFFYDLDLALAVISGPTDTKKGLIAYCPDAFATDSRNLLASFDGVDKIEVSLSEAQNGFATNLVSTGETVIMTAHAPVLAAELQKRGLKVLSPNITELAKGGGYIRCTTLTIG